jgi:hypothetical protein
MKTPKATALVLGILLALSGGVTWFLQESNASHVVYTPLIFFAQVMILTGGALIFPNVVYYVSR